MWNDLARAWQACFREAWAAYCHGSNPIGATIVNENDQIIASGRNRVYEKTAPSRQIGYNRLAHAELNALLQLNTNEHQRRRNYSLYSTMEPCLLCFSAVVMSDIRTVFFAALDRIGGGSNLKNKYIKDKKIRIAGPYKDLAIIQIALKTDAMLNYAVNQASNINVWRQDYSEGVELGIKLFKDKTLSRAKEKGLNFSQVYDMMQCQVKL